MDYIFTILAIILGILLLITKSRHKPPNKNSSSSLNIDLGNLRKPIIIGFSVFSASLLVISIYVLFQTFVLSFFNISKSGIITNITCATHNEPSNKCYRGFYSYTITYSVENRNYELITGPKGVKVKTPSRLYLEQKKVGDSVDIQINRFTPQNATLKGEIVDTWVYTFALLLVTIPLNVYCLKKIVFDMKEKKGGR